MAGPATRITDLASLFQDHRVESAPSTDRHVRDGWLQFHCPWCGSDKWHLGIRVSDGRVNCYACGPKRLSEAIRELCKVPNGEAVRLAIRYQSANRLPEAPGTRLKGRYSPPKGLGPLLPAHRAYLRQRGFNAKETAHVWKLKGIGPAGRLAWRIFLPVILAGRSVSWQTRAIGKSSMPYINAKPEEELLPAKSLLYGEDYAGNRIAIHEGAFDVFATGPGAVATLGVGFTEWQVLRLSRYPYRYIAFDNEPKAQQRAKQLADVLRIYPGKTYIVTIDAKDMAEASETERRRFRRCVFKKG